MAARRILRKRMSRNTRGGGKRRQPFVFDISRTFRLRQIVSHQNALRSRREFVCVCKCVCLWSSFAHYAPHRLLSSVPRPAPPRMIRANTVERPTSHRTGEKKNLKSVPASRTAPSAVSDSNRHPPSPTNRAGK